MLIIRVLGENAIVDESGSTCTHSARAVALTAYLALHAGIPQQRALIAGRFWPDSSSAQALTNLRRELHGLRSVLPAEALTVTSTDLCWHDNPGCVVDVRQFVRGRARALDAGGPAEVIEHASAATAAYRGDLLPGSSEEWVLLAREELRRNCLDLHRRVVAAAQRTGAYRTGIDAARKAMALDPLDEGGHRTLLRLQVAAGDRTGAINSYHQCASILEEQLGVAPEPDTTAIVEPLIGRAADRRSAQPARPEVGDSTLVGRGPQLRVLLDSWRDVLIAHRPSVVVVGGGPGVGKTRIVSDVARDLARRGAVTATATCFASAGRVPLAPVAEWLRTPELAAARASLDPGRRAEVARLLPELASQSPRRSERSALDPWQRHRFFEGLVRALLATEEPILLVLDNAQWCDKESLALLSLLLKLGEGHRLLVVLTVRHDAAERDPTVEGWTEHLASVGRATLLDLEPLDLDSTAQLAVRAGHSLDVEGAVALHSATGGFPLYVLEALRAGFDPAVAASPELTGVLRRRLDQCSPAAREVAGLAAAVGRDFSLDLLVEAADLPSEEVVRAVDELWRFRILRDIASGYDFSHDLLREAAYEEVSGQRRWLLHRRLAQALEILHAGRFDDVAAQLADQHARGGQPDRALRYYALAADSAADRFAYSEGVELRERALDIVHRLWPGHRRDEIEREQLLALIPLLNAWRGPAWAPLGDVLERLVDLAETAERKVLINGLIGLWSCRFVQGRMYDADRIVNRALALPITEPELHKQALAAGGGVALSMGRPAEAGDRLAIASQGDGAAALIVGPRTDVLALGWQSHALWLVGREDDARPIRHSVVRRGRTCEHPFSHAVALGYAAIFDQLTGDRDALAASVAELRGITMRYEFVYYDAWGQVLGGWLQGGDGGVAAIRSGLSSLREIGALVRMPYWQALLAETLFSAGRIEEALAELRAAERRAEASGDVWWLPEVLRLQATWSPPSLAGPIRERGLALARAHGSTALVQRYER